MIPPTPVIHPTAALPRIVAAYAFGCFIVCLPGFLPGCLPGCHPRHATEARSDVPGTTNPTEAPPEAIAPRPEPWCFTPRPLADLRAIDARGHVWAITHGTITDETTGVSTALPDEVPCPVRGAWALEFTRDGSAFALVDSRFYLRPSEHAAFGVTPMCSDVSGAPWSPRAEGGWSFVVRTWPASGPGLMLTNNPSGLTGWYAVTALDSTLTAAALETDRSLVFLANHGHLLFVDQTRHVAGEVLASHGALFTGLGRSAAGVVAFRDDGPTHRVLVTSGGTVQQPFTEVRGERPPGSPTRAVFRADVARVLAVTDTGVELSTDRGAHFTRVLDTAQGLDRTAFGWLDGVHPALTARQGLVTDHCLHTDLPDP